MPPAVVPTSPFLLPLCTVCGGPTVLARLDPLTAGEDAHDRRIFICADCGAQQTETIIHRK
jgi:hypothetical protein